MSRAARRRDGYAWLAAAALALGLGLGTGGSASGQSMRGLQGGDEPLEINAEDGIEWRRDEQLYIARGNALAVRGDLSVYADEMTAHYSENANQQTDIDRIDVYGNVRIVSPSETVYGDRGAYDVINGILVLVGDDLRIVGELDVITARDSLEYWERKQMAVARGDAEAIREDNQVKADVLTAYFLQGEGDKLKLERIDAYDNVRVSTPTEFARADRGVYYVDQELATLTGSVKLTRGDNQLNGQYAEVNLATGVSRLMASPPGEGSGDDRVKGLLVPDKGNVPESGS